MLTAKDLLYKALDYDWFWNSSRTKDSKPSKARKSQLDKLLKGFGITKKNARVQSQFPKEANENHQLVTVYWTSRNRKSMDRLKYIKTLTDFKYFTNGEFIADFDRAKYDDLIDQIILTTKAILPEQSKVIDKQRINLVQLFSDLYNFRLSVHHLFIHGLHGRISKELSIEDNYKLYLKKKAMESINESLSEVDAALCTLIDPEKRTLNEDEIDYLIFDLDAIDKEWSEDRLRK